MTIAAGGSYSIFIPRTTHPVAQLGNAEIVGISKNSVNSHLKFANKYSIDFLLLSDPNHATIAEYEAWRPKRFMGREFLGTNRDTFIVNPAGKIAKEYRSVNPKDHVTEIIADLQALRSI